MGGQVPALQTSAPWPPPLFPGIIRKHYFQAVDLLSVQVLKVYLCRSPQADCGALIFISTGRFKKMETSNLWDI